MNSFVKNKISKFHVYRMFTLSLYMIFTLIFNLFLIPFFNLGDKVEASSIDANQLVQLTNQDRTQNNLSPLTIDQRLVTAATNKAINMFKEQYWSHYGPNGETPWQFILAAGYTYTYAGENLAKDFSDNESINTAWMNSPLHKANILGANYTNIGIAAVSGKQICNGTYPDFSDNTLSGCNQTTIVVQMFGNQSSTPAKTTGYSQPALVKTSTPAPSPRQTPIIPTPNAPTINYPQNESYINSQTTDIKGSSDVNSNINIYENGKVIGSIVSGSNGFDAQNINFSEGSHIIKAIANKNGKPSSDSNIVTFTVDSLVPKFLSNDVSITLINKDKNEYNITGTFSSNTKEVTVNLLDKDVPLSRIKDNEFGGNANVSTGLINIDITAKSYSGNTFVNTFSLPDITLLQKDSNSSISGTVVKNNTRQILNIAIGVVLLLIFLGDSIFILFRNGIATTLFNIKGFNSLAEHTMPVIIVIISIFITISGNIV